MPLLRSRLAARSNNGLSVYRFVMLTSLLRWCGRREGAAPSKAVLTPRALLIWRERPDLQSAFELKLPTGRAGLFWWYLIHGYYEMGLEPDLDSAGLSQVVNTPLPHFAQHLFTPITWLMREVYRRSELNFGDLRTLGGQQALLNWFFAEGLMNRHLTEFLTKEQAKALLAPLPDYAGLPRILALIWQVEPDLQRRFSGLDDHAFLAWSKDIAARDFPILAHPYIALAPPWRPPNHVSGRFGVNLVGHAFGRSGLSEDIRAAALSLKAVGIPFAICNVSTGGAFVDEDMTLAGYATQELPFDINLLCFTGQTTVGTVLAKPELGRDRRHVIGMWPWELPEWPRIWQQAYGFVDEIWATSRFTYDAYCRSASVPVRHMPMAVTVNGTEGAERSDFGLASRAFLFAFAFDGLSTVNRKNPDACIDAFQLAFPDRNIPVGLVLKGLRTQGSAAFDLLNPKIQDDPRITVITDSISRDRLMDLYRAIDCFVSLHRSEGFGRNIAEAMLLEKPVIVTAHSGNMDFTGSDTAALVPARLITLADGDYPFGTGQTWAEADVVAAARLMRRMVTDATWRQSIARSGRIRIERSYSPHAVGERWQEVLLAVSPRR
jgi:glycosyltransferase involved in cell wall biosynthesis